jgi:hypothetical protein
METRELPPPIALPAVVTAGQQLVGDEAVGKPAGSTSAGSRAQFGERGQKGSPERSPPQRRGSGGGRQRRERHLAVDGGGLSAGEARGIGGDLVVVLVRLEERRGALPVELVLTAALARS